LNSRSRHRPCMLIKKVKKMKKIIIVSAFLLTFFASNSFAHAPAGVDLSYDLENQVLKVTVKHVTQAVRKHYIRKIEVIKNDEKPIDLYLYWQKDNAVITEEIKVKAEVGDILNVSASCKQGGSTTASLTVEEIVEEGKEKAQEPATEEQKGSE